MPAFPFARVLLLTTTLSLGWLQAQDKPVPTLKLTALTDRPEAIYRQGEPVTFVFTLTDQGQPVKEAELKWTQSKDGVAPTTSGVVKVVEGKASISGKLSEPGFLQCRVSYQPDPKAAPLTAMAGAGIDPLLIKPSMPVPDDFEAFWAGQKKKLAAVPLKATLTPVTTTVVKDADCFDAQIECLGAPVSGYFCKPKNAKPKSLPIVLLVHGAGVRSAQLNSAAYWCKNGVLAMDINAHGIPNGKPPEFYKELEQGALKGYPAFGRESRDTCYFLGMFLRELRALDFLCSQPEWDGTNVIVSGSSQGGFQAFAAAGLDARVTFFAAGVPAGCDHTGTAVNRINGWPKLVPNGPEGKPDPKVQQAARYFDNVNFAARTKAKGAIVTVGFIDVTCPPSTVYAAYNALPISKRIHNDPLTGHTSTPAASATMTAAVLEFLKITK
jgi:cephalosporin-C deacetylase